MYGLRIIPRNTKIDFIAWHKLVFLFSSFVLLICIGFTLFAGLNLGIDFKGGYLFEIKVPEGQNLSLVRGKMKSLKLGDVKVRSFDNDDTKVIINIEKQSQFSHEQIVEKVRNVLGKGVIYRKIDLLGAKVTNKIIKNAFYAVILSLVAMLFYVWVRFEWQFGVGAIVTQFHDVLLVMGFYSLFAIEFNATAIIAILTTLGYSINDTVVIYDRIRENLRRFEDKNIKEIINLSINETLTRNILTSGTTLLALFALYFFGGVVLESFISPIIFGVTAGAFSSIFISAPMLIYLPINRTLFQEQKEEKVDGKSAIDRVPIE